MTDTPPGGPVSERMQALLSRAVEEQVSEQRAASTILAEIKEQLGALEAAVRGAAADETVQRLGSAVSTVVADQRTATTLVSQRLEGLTRRLEELSALGEDVTSQAAALDRVQAALQAFGAFPDALSALQREVSGMADRLAPLGGVQSALGELAARAGGGVEVLRPQIAALDAKLTALGTGPDAERVRDAVVDALTLRLERLQQAADRPVVGPEVLKSGLGDLRAELTAAVGEQLDPVRAAVTALGGRLERLADRVGDSSGSADATAELATGLADLTARVEALQALGGELERVASDVRALREAEGGTADKAALEALSADVAHLAEQVAKVPALSVDDIAAHVSARVADRLVETLAPRIADVVLTRVSAAMVGQLAEALAPQLGAQTDAALRAATAASEARVLTHVDEGLLTLAETLLRRKAPARAETRATSRPPAEPLPTEPLADVMDRLDAPVPPAPATASAVAPGAQAAPVAAAAATAEAPARPAVTTGMAPAPAPAGPPASAPAAPAQEPAEEPARAQTKAAPAPARPSGTRPVRRTDKPAGKGADGTASKAAKAPARRQAAKAPAKKAAPRPRPQPLLERTPDLEASDSDLAPVRPPAPPAPSAPPPPGLARPSVAPPPPPVAPAPPPAAQPEPPKRKAWWRPGG